MHVAHLVILPNSIDTMHKFLVGNLWAMDIFNKRTSCLSTILQNRAHCDGMHDFSTSPRSQTDTTVDSVQRTPLPSRYHDIRHWLHTCSRMGYTVVGIKLFLTITKILTAIMLCHLIPIRESKVREQQGAFRPVQGCVDQVFILCQLPKMRHTLLSNSLGSPRLVKDIVRTRSLRTFFTPSGHVPKLLGKLNFWSMTGCRVDTTDASN